MKKDKWLLGYELDWYRKPAPRSHHGRGWDFRLLSPDGKQTRWHLVLGLRLLHESTHFGYYYYLNLSRVVVHSEYFSVTASYCTSRDEVSTRTSLETSKLCRTRRLQPEALPVDLQPIRVQAEPWRTACHCLWSMERISEQGVTNSFHMKSKLVASPSLWL